MLEQRLKDIVGNIVFWFPFLIVSELLYYWFEGGFLLPEMTTALLLILPIFTAQTTLVLKYWIANKTKARDNRKTVSLSYAVASIGIPVGILIFVAVIIPFKAYNHLRSFEEFKTMLGASQIVFGGYFALIISSLFDIQSNSLASKQSKK